MQRIKNGLYTLIILVLAIQNSYAYIPAGFHGKPASKSSAPQAGYREECAQAKSQIDLNINNVRARLQGGGDIWWDLKDNGLYVIPNVPAGIPPVSSIFAGGIWIGGVDAGGNLKTACTLYRRAADNDWWPGPLDISGTIDAQTCSNWDKHFIVYGKDIDLFKSLYEVAPKDASGRVLDASFIDQVPLSLKGWPSKGNPYFTEVHGFGMPANVKKFAYFWDKNGDEKYDPLDGDYPAIFVRYCENSPQYADEMIFWIFNDAGGVHTQSNGQPIRMEVQVQAFAYATNDEINNMSFMAYRLANRASQEIDSMFFAVWTDPDLGCSVDDYIGCDNTLDATGKPRSMMYVYNEDAVDGKPGATCAGGVNTYGEKVPILGVDYFRGPVDPFKKVWNDKLQDSVNLELGMSSFMYFNRADAGSPPPATTDPNQVSDFYNYLNAIWKDGTPLSIGGTGYTQNPDPKNITKYAYLDEPQNPSGWSMAAANIGFGDRRTLQASGPFKLVPGTVNELIVGVPWVPDQGGGKVSLAALRKADDKAQGLFDSCFDILDGPDAPDVSLIELDKEIVMVLSNGNPISNNKDEMYGLDARYREKQPESPTTGASPYYVFEGYKVYQLAGPEVGTADVNDPAKAKLVAEVDTKNNVIKQFNWESVDDPNDISQAASYPVLKVEGNNKGIEHTFSIKQDLFAKGQSKALINHKKYYFITVAYAHNEYQKFDKKTGLGQKITYVEGRRNISIVTAIPRPIVDKKLNTSYGSGAVITRIDGIGVGGNFVEMSDDTRTAILNKSFNGAITYKPGKGPISIKIYNPLEAKDGKFELTFVDADLSNQVLDAPVKWKLVNLANPTEEILSDVSIDRLNEQVIAKYGFSIGIGQTTDAGIAKSGANGVIGGAITYKNPNGDNWFFAIPDEGGPVAAAQGGGFLFDFIKSGGGEELNDFDKDQAFSTRILDGAFIPYAMCDYKLRPVGTTNTPYATPAWFNNSNSAYYLKTATAALQKLGNVDIVLTPDKSKWSRCVVVETINKMQTDEGLESEKASNLKGNNFDLRAGKTVGSDTDPDAPSDGSYGKSWFPGYAVDVETGKRLNILFGENSGFDPANDVLTSSYKFNAPLTGRDMIWNPTSDVFVQSVTPGFPGILNLPVGCGHYIYVMNQDYDGCAELYTSAGSTTFNRNIAKAVQWTCMPIATKLLSYKDGLIPNECTINLRVDNPYSVETGTGAKKGYPTYQFSLDGVQAGDINTPELTNKALDAINVVPNPYYAYSAYETSQFTNTIKVTNLPAKCVVTIYSLDGKFIRQYRRDEVPVASSFTNGGTTSNQITPALEWDLKNNKGITVASGTYIIHVQSDLGEKTIKWFGALRPFDPSGL